MTDHMTDRVPDIGSNRVRLVRPVPSRPERTSVVQLICLPAESHARAGCKQAGDHG